MAACLLAQAFATLSPAANPFTSTQIRQLNPSSRRTSIILSEIMYHPTNRVDGLDLEYIELFNADPVDTDLGGYRIAGDADYRFPASAAIPARSFLVVAKDPVAVRQVYGITNVTGPLTGALPDGGGTIRLRSRADALFLEVNYRDEMPWPVAADGAGHSLVLARPDLGEGYVEAWDASARTGGSPGTMDVAWSDALSQVKINEFLAHTDLPQVDFIELFNSGSQSADLSGCRLSNAADTNKFTIPAGTILGPRQCLALTQDQFGFDLKMEGDEIFFARGSGEAVLDAVRFGAQSNGASTGRSPDGAPVFSELAGVTPGGLNALPRTHPIVINEIMYHPLSGYDDDQYVEIHNRGGGPVDVSLWRLEDGVSFMFPAGTVIPAGGYLVVAKDAARLLSRYPNLTPANTFGNFSGALARSGERIALVKPDDPQLPYQDFVLVDEVTYSDGWGAWTDGGGSSLELTDPRADNRRGANWAGSDETQKAPWTLVDCLDSVDNGIGDRSPFEIFTPQAGGGEFILDDLIVSAGSSTNLYDNFESGASGWGFNGCFARSSVESGVGYGGSKGLYLRSSERGEFSGADGRFVNHAEKGLASPALGEVVRIRAKVRWLRGFPFLTLGLRGYWAASPGDLSVPTHLGTPGQRNSAYAANVGPAIDAVAHSPVLPEASSNVTVTCRANDPDGVAAVALKYRVDPAYVTNTVTMRDDGGGADRFAGDGIFSASMPGRSSGTVVAFTIEATDAAAARSRFPSKVIARAPATECLVAWGVAKRANMGLQSYRYLMTQANSSLLSTYGGYARELVDCTLVHNDTRAVYNASTRYHAGVHVAGAVFRLPKNDRIHGATKVNIMTTELQRIRYLPWLCFELDEPAALIRPTAYAAGTGALALNMDYQTPGAELCSAWFDDEDPEAFKNQDWNTDGFGYYTNKFGQMKKSRYAGLQQKRSVLHPNDDYSQVYKIATTVRTPDNAKYVARVKAVIDLRSWASFFAFAGLFGDTDHYGYTYMHNYYVYIPRHGRSTLMLHDMDWSFGSGASVRWPTSHPVPSRMFYSTPEFTRNYWSVLKDAADGPMQAARTDKFYDQWYSAFRTNGFDPGNPSGFKSYVVTARQVVNAGLASIHAAFAITNNNGNGFSTAVNPLTLGGTAPVHVDEIRVNGQPHAVTYPTLTTWRTRVWLQPGANLLAAGGYDRAGNLVTNGSDTITVQYTGPETRVDDKLVISEIMYNPITPYASFVELYNRSPVTLSLGGLRLEGVDCEIGYGNMIAPYGYAVVAQNIPGYQAAYGNAEVVVGEYGGELDNGGETLRLWRPQGTNAWVLVDEVRYDDDAPWPAHADGQGTSLQLLDPAQDNNRPANWGSVDLDPPLGWRFASVSGTSTSNIRVIANAAANLYLGTKGTAYVDQVHLCTGAAPEQGTNLLRNGGFEDASWTGNWAAAGTHAASAASTNERYSGAKGLRLAATAAGSSAGNSVSQGSLGLRTSQPYTLSCWYLPTRGATGLTLQVTMTSLRLTEDIAPDPVLDPLCTPGASSSVALPLPALPRLWINEVMGSNSSVRADNHGEYEPWVELYNADTNAVALGADGYYLSNSYAELLRWRFPAGAVIEPGERLLVWADAETNESAAGALHAGFRLGGTSGSVALVRRYLDRPLVLDYLDYGPLGPNLSYGAWPEGEPYSHQVFHSPTPGAANSPTSLPVRVWINEWMADNASTVADPSDGKFQDWFELWNPGAADVDLSGYWLADGLARSNQFAVPQGTVIRAGEHMLVWADEDTAANGPGVELHAGFKLDKGGEAIALFAPDGQPVDGVAFGPQVTDLSEGRWPDGDPRVWPMAPPTPRAANQVLLLQGACAEPGDGGFTLVWSAQPGEVYRMDWDDALSPTNWRPVGVATAAGPTATLTDTGAPSPGRRFYRVIRLP